MPNKYGVGKNQLAVLRVMEHGGWRVVGEIRRGLGDQKVSSKLHETLRVLSNRGFLKVDETTETDGLSTGAPGWTAGLLKYRITEQGLETVKNWNEPDSFKIVTRAKWVRLGDRWYIDPPPFYGVVIIVEDRFKLILSMRDRRDKIMNELFHGTLEDAKYLIEDRILEWSRAENKYRLERD